MPSKKRKYNARFPAGRIKKIMQTDEEVGKVAQAVPIIISRTLELFVQSLLGAALQVTVSRNAKTLSPSHLKQCITAEARFDFLHDLVKNIPDVSAAEEKEIEMSAENSPNTSRYADMSVPRRIAREDSNSSSSSELRNPKPAPDSAIDLTKKTITANFYQETLNLEETAHASVIQPNPIYTAQPSTSYIDKVKPLNNNSATAPVTPVLNIDFSKNPALPEIKVLDATLAAPKAFKAVRQNSRQKTEVKKAEPKPQSSMSIDYINSGNLQIDEDYDA